MQLECRYLDLASAGVRIETRGEGQPVITGYAARYYDPNVSGTEFRLDMGKWGVIHERIMPGAFNRALNEDDVVGLFNHDPNHILGRMSAKTLTLRTDDKGLVYEITPPASAGNVVESIRRGDLRGSSFAFMPRLGGQTWRDAEIDKKEVTIRELTDVQLFDVSPVTYPAYPATSTGVRAFSVEDLTKEIEAHRKRQAEAKSRINGNHAMEESLGFFG